MYKNLGKGNTTYPFFSYATVVLLQKLAVCIFFIKIWKHTVFLQYYDNRIIKLKNI